MYSKSCSTKLKSQLQGHPWNDPEVQKKCQESIKANLLANEEIVNVFQRDSAKERNRLTWLANLGVDFLVMHIQD